MASNLPTEVPPSSFLFQSDGHGVQVFSRLQRERQLGNFLDFGIRIGEQEIRAHRLVLSVSIPYISGLFNVEDAQPKAIALDHLDGQAVSDLIDFVYTGQLNITTDNVQSLLVAADYLNMSEICGACSSFLQERLDPDCCVAMFCLGEQLALGELMEATVAYIERNIERVASTAGDFQALPGSVLLKMLGSEKLSLYGPNSKVLDPVSQETVLSSIVLQYVEKSLEDNAKYLFDLLRSVRLPVISSDELASLKKKLMKLQSQCASQGVTFDKGCLETIDEADKASMQAPTNESSGAWFRPRRYSGLQMMPGGVYATTGMVAGPAKGTFDDGSLASDGYITGMTLWIRRWDGRPVLGGIAVNYSNGKAAMHGSDSFEEHHSFSLSSNERIQRVELGVGWMVDRLTFYTNFEKTYGSYGGPGGGKAEEKAPAACGYLAYMRGRVMQSQGALCIRHLQFVWGWYDYNFMGEKPQQKPKQPRTCTPRDSRRRYPLGFHPD